MDADRNLLFGVLALRADLIDAAQLEEACRDWADRKGVPLADLLVERGWLTPAERADVERLLECKPGKHPGDARASLAAGEDGNTLLSTVTDVEAESWPPPPTQPGSTGNPPPAPFVPPSRARYTLTRVHATGGIGRVWLAHDDRLGRDVALKELRPEMAREPAHWSRFLREARVTGQLEHPGIVPVYELAERPGDRQPFYVMRFVQGRTLRDEVAAYHGERRAGRAGPLQLAGLLNAFVAVCNAVAYAHSRGVIHRDLKGPNVLLGEFGEVILLDWGLAKVLDGPEGGAAAAPLAPGPDGDETRTAEGQVMGTPAYLAPEQAEGRVDRIDARTDVYGLGAILYEVLTGRPPFTGRDLHELLRRVREEEPARPRDLWAGAPPALEAVCLKALAKKPEGRYPSARALAGEVQRYLADEPVEAYPEPLSARAARWARQHKPAVTAAATFLVAAVIALAAGTVLLGRANARTGFERDRAEANFHRAEEQRDEAETNLRLAHEAVDKSFTIVSENKLLRRSGMQPVRKELLEASLKYYDYFLRKRSDDPGLRAEVAETYRRVAYINDQIGSPEDALTAYRKAVELYEEVLRGPAPGADVRPDLARAYDYQAILQRRTGRTKDALGSHGRARELRRQLVREHPDVPEYQSDLARTYNNLAILHALLGQQQEALACLTESRRLREGLRDGPLGGTEALQTDLARTYTNLGVWYSENRRLAEALQAFRQSRTILEALFAAHHTAAQIKSLLALTCYHLGRLQDETGKTADALRSLQRACALQQGLVRTNGAVNTFKRDLAQTYFALGGLHRRAGSRDKALKYYQGAEDLLRPLVAGKGAVNEYRYMLSRVHYAVGNLRADRGQLEEAYRCYEEARVLQMKLVDTSDEVPWFRAGLAATFAGLGDLQTRAGKPARALPHLRQARNLLEPLLGPGAGNAEYHSQLAEVLHGEGEALGKLGRHGEARDAFRKAVEHQRRAFTQAPEVTSYRGSLGKHYAELARAARELGDEAEAAAATRERQALGSSDPVPGAKPAAGSP